MHRGLPQQSAREYADRDNKVQHGDFFMWLFTNTLPAAGEQLFVCCIVVYFAAMLFTPLAILRRLARRDAQLQIVDRMPT